MKVAALIIDALFFHDAEARASEPADTLPGERAACAQRPKLEAHY